MRFRLSPPGLPAFLLSFVLAALAVATLYWKISAVGPYVSSHRFWVLATAYVVLLLGVVVEGL